MKTIANFTLLISLCVFLTFTLLSQKPGSSTRISERVLQSAGNIVSPSAGQDSSGEDADDTQYIHSLVNVIVWGLLADIAIIIVRFFRGTNLRIWRFSISMQAIHGILMITVIASSVAATIQLSGGSDDEQGQNQSNTDIKEHNDDGPDKDFHSTVGTIMFVLMALTVCLGLIGYLIIIPYNKKRRPILVVKRLHQVFGTILYLCAKANVITGAILYADGDWQIPVFAGLGALALIHIVLQALYSYKFHFANKASPTTREFSKKSMHIALIDVINKGIPREDIIATFPKLKWVILGNKVYDLTGWIHPGGNFMIEACVGREVGRYFFGNIALEGSKIAPHKHSALTLSQMQKFCIGEVTNCESVLMVKSGKEEIISSSSRKWKIVATINSSPTVSEIRFHCPDFQFKNFGTSLSWLGRHYCLSQDTNRSLARLYTTAFSLSNSNCNLRQSIFKYFEDVMNGAENSMFSYDSNYLLPQDSLPLYIKSYPRGFSNLVHKTDIGHHSNQFRVEGPQGRGLELTPSSTGAHYIICAGTGVLPFVDFLNLFLWKTMYTLIKQKAGAEKAEKINILQIPFDTFFNDMNIIFIGAFPNQKEVLGLDIITKLADISQRYNVNNFGAMMKGHFDDNIKEVQQSFTSEFFSKVIKTNGEKYYVVGPSKFNEIVPRELQEVGVAKDKIMLV